MKVYIFFPFIFVHVLLVCVFSSELKRTSNDAAGSDRFGYDVAICNDYAVVGATYDDDNESNSGSAYIFYKDQNGTDTWGQQAKLLASDGAAGDEFGYAVAIDGDYVVVGAPYADIESYTSAGSAYVYKRSGSTWTQCAKLAPGDLNSSENFGISVDIHDDYVIVGAPEAWCAPQGITGAAYIFRRDGADDNWVLESKVFSESPTNSDAIGWAVAIHGDYAAIGAPKRDEGSVFIYKNEATGWQQLSEHNSDDLQDRAYFGWSLDMDDSYLLIGSKYYDVGSENNAGAAYLFQRDADCWCQIKKMVQTDAVESDFFGYSVALFDNYLLIGASEDDENSLTKCGSASSFLQFNDECAIQKKFTPGDITGNDKFGTSLGIAENWSIIGAPYAGTSYEGAVYFYHNISDLDCPDVEAVDVCDNYYFNETSQGGDGHTVDMQFTQLTGVGDVYVKQNNCEPTDPPTAHYVNYVWDLSKEDDITTFTATVSFHYLDGDVTEMNENELQVYRWDGADWQPQGGTAYPNENRVEITLSGFSDYGLFEGDPIGLDLVFFDAIYENGFVCLSWETASEIGLVGFNVLRSKNKQNKFAVVNNELIFCQGGQVRGALYEYIDNPLESGDYDYKLQLVFTDGRFSYSDIAFVTVAAAIKSHNSNPQEFSLSQNFPNPFNPSTIIKFCIPKDEYVQIEVYNIHGEKMCSLVNEKLLAGTYSRTWKGSNSHRERLPSGIYFYKMTAGDFVKMKKLTLMK